MKKKNYRIKNTQTGLFWAGYGSIFDATGTKYPTYGDAGRGLAGALRLKHTSLLQEIPHLEIVEYEVVVNEVGQTEASACIAKFMFETKLREKFGYGFDNAYAKIQKTHPETTFTYGICVPRDAFDDFRSTMKMLGFSSRHYRKVDEWLWTDNPDIIFRTKLLDYSTAIVDLKKEAQEFNTTSEFNYGGLV